MKYKVKELYHDSAPSTFGVYPDAPLSQAWGKPPLAEFATEQAARAHVMNLSSSMKKPNPCHTLRRNAPGSFRSIRSSYARPEGETGTGRSFTLITRYAGATNTRGAGILVSYRDADGESIRTTRVPYDYDYSAGENHAKAAGKVAATLAPSYPVEKTLLPISGADHYAHIFETRT